MKVPVSLSQTKANAEIGMTKMLAAVASLSGTTENMKSGEERMQMKL